MIPFPESIWLGAIGVMLAVALSTTWTLVTRITPGMIRKLEDRSEALAHQLNDWVAEFQRLRVTLHLLLVVDVLFLMYCSSSWLSYVEQEHIPTDTAIFPFVIAVVFYLLITEWWGRRGASYATARYLVVTLRLFYIVSFLVYPVLLPLRKAHSILLKLRNAPVEDDQTTTAEDEIKSLVEEGDEQDTLKDEDRRRIQGIFDLQERLVRDIMTPRVDINALPADVDIDTVKQTIVSTGHSRIPVYNESIDHIIGVVYAKDLLNDEKVTQARGVHDFFHAPGFIPETRKIGNLLTEFQQTRIHIAIVIDEYGGTSGVVTFEDILEEIVGEIRDEYDVNEPMLAPQKLSDGSILVDGRAEIKDVNDALGVNLPEGEEFATVGGYIVAEHGRIPSKNEQIENDEVVFTVIEADDRRVLQVKIAKLPTEEESE